MIQFQSLGWEDSLEEEMAIHSSIPAGEVPLDRGAWGATDHGVTKSQTQLGMHARTLLSLAGAISSHCMKVSPLWTVPGR